MRILTLGKSEKELLMTWILFLPAFISLSSSNGSPPPEIVRSSRRFPAILKISSFLRPLKFSNCLILFWFKFTDLSYGILCKLSIVSIRLNERLSSLSSFNESKLSILSILLKLKSSFLSVTNCRRTGLWLSRKLIYS